MKYFLLTLCLFFSNFAFSQEMQDVYVLVGVFSKSSTKYLATVDFGDGTSEVYMGDSNGQKKIFHSAFEPVKSLLQKGWEIGCYQPVTAPGATFFTWILKKKVNKGENTKNDFAPVVKD